MKELNIFLLLLRKSIRLWYIILVFAFLFAVTFFVLFVSGDVLQGVYEQIVSKADSELIIMDCDYNMQNVGESDASVYFSEENFTYEITIKIGDYGFYIKNTERGINLCNASSSLNEYIDGEQLVSNEQYIWISKYVVEVIPISYGEQIIFENGSIYTFAGSYDSDISQMLCTGITPSFILYQPCSNDNAKVVCTADNVFELYKSDLGPFCYNDDGIMDMCQGYALFKIIFFIFSIFILLGVLLIAVKCLKLFNIHFSSQTFIWHVFGCSYNKLCANYIGVLCVFCLVALIFSVGIFYLLYNLAQNIAIATMAMTLANIEILNFVVLGFLVGVTIVFGVEIIHFNSLKKRRWFYD